MPVSTKHAMAIEAEARNIDARNGGSITKNRMKPATTAMMLAMIAKTMLTVRSCAIANLQRRGRATIRLTPGRSRVYAVGSSNGPQHEDRLGVLN